eukprot:TRINITY_DN647_c0_g1_i1.p1 TRINITY_DN647_c0_g1~~TRINITY_DN647_c0_g1_i1.p1  ORF type:complete len:200 (+),score=16.50 TRINITY_DN647_c0_g1_i1:39-638(+)
MKKPQTAVANGTKTKTGPIVHIKRRNRLWAAILGLSAAGVGYALPHSSILNHYSIPQLHLIQFVVALLWTGFVLAISFMEAPVKFRAQSLPKSIAVDVGRTVFWALNRVELVFATTVAFICFVENVYRIQLLVPVGLLVFQVLLLQPILDRRAIHYNINGVPPSSGHIIHTAYVLIELTKVGMLSWFAWTFSQQILPKI